MKLNLSKEWYDSRIPKEDCLDCGVCNPCIDRSIAMSEELEADNTDELIEAMKEGFAVRLADVEEACETHKARIAELRQALIRLACYAATVESENTLDWMDGLVSHLNSAAVTVNEPKQFVLHRSNGDGAMWITVRDIP